MTDVTLPPERLDAPDLFHGGMLYRVMHRFGVEPEHAARAARRGVIAALVLWGPMAAAAFLEGVALPGRVQVPFLLDVAAYVRPLLVVPLLLAAEPILAASWRQAGARLRGRGIVVPECRDAFEALVRRITGAVRGFLPEIFCLVVAGLLTAKLVALVLSEPRDAWFAATDGSGATRLTMAGGWAALVHFVLFYLSVRWLWLLSLWYRFLLGVARLPIRLYPAHPDRAAGLGFVGRTLGATAPLAFAWSAMIASAVANRMIHAGEHLASFAPVGGAVLAFVLLVFVVPPSVIFLPLLVRTRRLALEDWSRRMAFRAEEEKDASRPLPAVANDEPKGEVNLEELAIAVEAVRAMRPVPLALSHLVGPIVATAVPVVPLLFVAFPARRILDELVRLVL